MQHTKMQHTILNNSISTFEHNTGYTCIIGGLSGSVAKGLSVKKSDLDYLVLFVRNDFPDVVHQFGEENNSFKVTVSDEKVNADILYWDFTSIPALFNEFCSTGKGGEQLNIFFTSWPLRIFMILMLLTH